MQTHPNSAPVLHPHPPHRYPQSPSSVVSAMDHDAQAMSTAMPMFSLQRETCNQHTTTTKEERESQCKCKCACVYASWRAYALSKLVTVSCLRFEVAAAIKRGILAFCAISVQIRVVQENNDTHVLPMISSDPPHLQYYHDCQIWVLIVDDHRSWR
jgi:hypothetical protein